MPEMAPLSTKELVPAAEELVMVRVPPVMAMLLARVRLLRVARVLLAVAVSVP